MEEHFKTFGLVFSVVYNFKMIVSHIYRTYSLLTLCICLCRPICSLGDKDTDEEINHHSRRCRPKRISEKMQSDWFKMNNRLSTLRQVRKSLTVLI